jgi:hypothetical protein
MVIGPCDMYPSVISIRIFQSLVSQTPIFLAVYLGSLHVSGKET